MYRRKFHRMILTCLSSFATIFLHAQSATQYTITTIVGNGTQGTPTAVGDGGAPTSAELNLPFAVVYAGGNLYIVDENDERIRYVANGTITTVAGNGTAGYTGDKGQGNKAELDAPSGLAVDSSGNLYIADTANGVIRDVTASGTITTQNIGYTFANPSGLALDSAGNLYIANTSFNQIVKVLASNGTISIYAGNGVPDYSGDGGPAKNAALNNPVGLAFDTAGNLYIADTRNSRIRMVSGATGIITTVAGSFNTGFGGDGASATASGARLNNPEGVAVDAAGNIYIADAYNYRIRKVSNGIISTIAGTGKSGYTGDGGPATSATVNQPAGVAVDPSGNVYVADTDNNVIRKLTPTSSGVAPAISTGGIVPIYSTSSTIQPSEWVSIYGSNLAGSATTWNGDFPTTLGGTSVTIDNKPAYLWYVSPTLINLQAPDDTSTGSVNVTVTNASGIATGSVTLGQFSPSFSLLDNKHVAGIILRTDGSGSNGQGTASYDIVGPNGNSLGYKTVAAKAGDSLVLYGVGFGPTNPAVPAGKPFQGAAPITNTVQVMINGITLPQSAISFAGISSAGLYQINLTVPSGAGTGDQPLVATIGGVQTQSNVVLALQ